MDDDVAEGTEQLVIRGSNAEPGLPVSGVRVTLTDNDAQPTAITLSLDRNTVAENGGAQRLTVTAVLEGDSRRTVDTSVRLQLVGQTAGESDYSGLTGVLTIKAGESEGAATLVLVPRDDYIDEDDETLEVTGSTAESRAGPALEVSGVVVTITDDDTAGVTVTPTELFVVEGGSGSYRVALGTQPSADVTVAVAAGHAGTNITLSGDTLTDDALTFTPDNWSTAQTVTVTAVQDDDATASPDVTLTHTVSGTGEYAGVTAADVVVSITEDDEPGVTIPETELTIVEGATATYTVVLDTKPTDAVTVAVAGHADTDITLSGDTLTDDALTFTSDDWNTAQTVTVTAAQDDDAASDDAVTLTHTANGGDYVDVQETVTVTIVEKDTSVLSVEAAQAAEDGGNMEFTVSISAASGEEVTVDYATSDGTATKGQDYTETTGTLTFPALVADSKTILVPVADDAVDEEEEETFTLTLSNVQGASLAGGESTLAVTGTITDDDDPAVTASFGQASYSVAEGGTVEVTVTLSADPEREVAVQLTHDPQGDTGSEDYSGVPGNLVFQKGDTEKSFTFSATDDDIDDDGESVALGFGTMPDGVSPGTTATVTITDDDTAGVTVSKSALSVDEGGSGTYTVKLATQPTGDVTVAVAGHSGTDITLSGDTLTNDALTFTADNWDSAQTVTVTAGEDDDAVNEEEATLTHTVTGTGEYAGVTAGSVTVTIVEKDTAVLSVEDAEAAEDAGNVVFTVSISAASGQEVTVGYATSDVTATKGQDYTETTGTLTFAANSVANQTISVPVTDDAVDEAEEETFTLTLSNVQGASLAQGGETLAVTGTITDDDDPAVTANFGQASYSVNEGGTVQVTVTLSADPEREVTVQLSHDPQGDTGSGDYSGVPGNLVFQKGDTEKSFTFTAAADDIDDDGESVALGFGTMPDGVTAGATATVTITDDDTAGVTVSKSALGIDEGATGSYTVVLDTEPTGNVTVAIAGHSGTDITLSGDTLTNDALTFTSDDWNTAQTVTATAAQDDDAASDAAVTLTHTANGGGYVAVQETVTVTITEDDTASPSLDLSLPVPTNNDADDSGDVTLNDVLTYTATATNDGNVPLSGVTLSDLLVDEDGHVCGSLDIGEQCQLTGTHTVVQTDVDAGVVANTVTAEATELTTAVTASQQTPVAQESTLTLTKTTTATSFTSVGDTISYGYEVTNGGTVTLSGTLAISDDKIGSSDITCGAVPDGGLAPSASVTCSGTYTVVQADLDAGGVTNKASASLDGATSSEATATVPWKAPQASTKPQVSIEVAVQVTEDAGTAEVAVSLSESSLQTVTVDYATSDGTATAGTDYVASSSTLTFAPGITEQKIRVTVINDAVDEEEENETFTITLTGPNNASLGASSGTVTITDDDDPSVTASFGRASYSVAEGGTVEVTVTLSADPEREVTVQLTHDPQGGAGSGDYSGVPGSLVFQKGDTEKSFTFSATADDIDDDGESVALGFGTMPDSVSAGTGATATVTITDDDAAGVTVSETALNIDEGGSGTYTVVLDTEPTASVTVAVAGHAGTDISLDKTSLTFTASTWDTRADGDGDRRRGQRCCVRRRRHPDPHRQRRRLRRCTGDGDGHHRGEGRLGAVGRRRRGRRGRRERGVHREHQRGQRPGGDGGLRHLRRDGHGGPGLHRDHWHADLRGKLGCQSDHLGAGHRRRGGRGGGGDLHPDPEQRTGGVAGRWGIDPGGHRDHHRR